MFVGHYGVAFGAKPLTPTVPLWVYFIAVQWLDVVWSILVLLGIEKLHIVPGFTEANALDLYYMPYTHGLPGAAHKLLPFPFMNGRCRRTRGRCARRFQRLRGMRSM